MNSHRNQRKNILDILNVDVYGLMQTNASLHDGKSVIPSSENGGLFFGSTWI